MADRGKSQCVVSGEDFETYWKAEAQTPGTSGGIINVYYVPKYVGPERRANAHDRRFYNGQGGRRRFDRKS